MTAKNSIQDEQIQSVLIFDFQNFLFQIIPVVPLVAVLPVVLVSAVDDAVPQSVPFPGVVGGNPVVVVHG
jgi:hypothetical protein